MGWATAASNRSAGYIAGVHDTFFDADEGRPFEAMQLIDRRLVLTCSWLPSKRDEFETPMTALFGRN